MFDWDSVNLSKTIFDYEYTKRAALQMNRILDAKEFEEMDAEMIFQFLINSMEMVSFHDYLKRYIFEKAEMEEDFFAVTDSDYTEIIKECFAERGVPFSVKPTSRKQSVIIRSWLTQESVTRETIFLLGFGLNMSEQDVTDFLTKVLKEEDFNFQDIHETIYWYCFHNGYGYHKAEQLLAQADHCEKPLDERTIQVIGENPKIYLSDIDNLFSYLYFLARESRVSVSETKANGQFLQLYDRARHEIAENWWADENLSYEDIVPAHIEQILCSGIPHEKNGNLKKMADSALAKHFKQRCMSRQRLVRLLSGKQRVERFDLITILFLIYAIGVESDWPVERYLQFVDQVNQILENCGFGRIYPVNPYEAFVLICILSEEPLAVYGDVLEKSYMELE